MPGSFKFTIHGHQEDDQIDHVPREYVEPVKSSYEKEQNPLALEQSRFETGQTTLSLLGVLIQHSGKGSRDSVGATPGRNCFPI